MKAKRNIEHSTSKGPGSLILRLTDAEFALARFMRSRGNALNYLWRVRQGVVAAGAVEACLHWARKEGGAAREHYREFCEVRKQREVVS